MAISISQYEIERTMRQQYEQMQRAEHDRYMNNQYQKTYDPFQPKTVAIPVNPEPNKVLLLLE
jgi:hypothetical protein